VIIKDKSREIGSQVVHLNTVDSTNNYTAKKVLERDIEHGTVILAEEQTNGRGQRENVWQSEGTKNLQFSIFLKPSQLSPNDQVVLSYLTCVSLVMTLQDYQIVAFIKWPNDLLVKEKKIAGILIENQIQGSILKHSIVGIGLNVNQVHFEGVDATSLSLEKKVEIMKEEVFENFLNHFNALWNTYTLGLVEPLRNLYYKHLFGYRTLRKFSDNEGVFAGIIEGVDSLGRLQVYKNGQQVVYNFKEVEFLYS
jgi:BirA family biotin operon repressor/biotin-[acetyl-CoA-carboxylase] ligase